MHSEWKEGDIIIEDGFICSSGLGVELHKPLSLIYEDVGIYFDATKASKLENLLNRYDV